MLYIKDCVDNDAAIGIWRMFKEHFDESNLTNVERLTGNEEMGRYVFSAKNELDQVECVINTPGEWNIPLIQIKDTLVQGIEFRILTKVWGYK